MKQERTSIIQYADRKRQTMTSFSPEGTGNVDLGATTKTAKELAADLSNTMLEQVLYSSLYFILNSG